MSSAPTPMHPEPAQVEAATWIEEIAQQWDGCVYDAGASGDIDIGAAIRSAWDKRSTLAALRPQAAPAEQPAGRVWGATDARSVAPNSGQTPQAAEPVPAPVQPAMPEHWSVEVTAGFDTLVSIGNDWLSGSRSLDEADEQTIIGAARHLLSFVGYGLPPSSFDPDADATPPVSVERDAADARRYRWLRASTDSKSDDDRAEMVKLYADEYLDRAIDAALAQQGDKEQQT